VSWSARAGSARRFGRSQVRAEVRARVPSGGGRPAEPNLSRPPFHLAAGTSDSLAWRVTRRQSGRNHAPGAFRRTVPASGAPPAAPIRAIPTAPRGPARLPRPRWPRHPRSCRMLITRALGQRSRWRGVRSRTMTELVLPGCSICAAGGEECVALRSPGEPLARTTAPPARDVLLQAVGVVTRPPEHRHDRVPVQPAPAPDEPRKVIRVAVGAAQGARVEARPERPRPREHHRRRAATRSSSRAARGRARSMDGLRLATAVLASGTLNCARPACPVDCISTPEHHIGISAGVPPQRGEMRQRLRFAGRRNTPATSRRTPQQ